jgi:hypothetical protein
VINKPESNNWRARLIGVINLDELRSRKSQIVVSLSIAIPLAASTKLNVRLRRTASS